MTPSLWFIFALVAVGSLALLGIGLATAPRNKDDER